jgi:hypothetical protein
MDKTIIIDGQKVVFRKTAGTMMRYKRQFGRELSPDLAKIYDIIPLLTQYTDSEAEPEEGLTDEQRKAQKKAHDIAAAKLVLSIETEYMYDIAYIMAAQADPSIVDQMEWLDRFNSMNIMDVFMQLLPLIQAEMRVSPKNA